ncbi:aminoacyl-tRNA hydrolase [Evansella tamaricis]|uniref:Peptidyl-tRNA hydrolase n=1 Tax=Evansella tamaricis TaxID=2069301 RepID=A0ABS6JCL2_9BACI|nr:aminoacyl-tRNA hydrolase [Evansella tamaricis]MBU9710165.1 aminoacyl-tRNA hydrolase [Evansella tamaricis]
MKLIVGLGNPGIKYDGTRHNIGFEVIDRTVEKFGIDLDQSKFKGIYGFKKIGNNKLFLLKPLTYMNLSGESIVPLMNYFKIEKEELLVIYDDLDLPPGSIRLREKGGHGGHNGIKSIISQLGTDEFKRIRVGIGRPPKGQAVPDYVLGRFMKEEQISIDEAVERSLDAIDSWTKTSFINVMNQYN